MKELIIRWQKCGKVKKLPLACCESDLQYQDGFYYLRDIANSLNVPLKRILKVARISSESEREQFCKSGIRLMVGRHIVYMPVFWVFYTKNKLNIYKHIPVGATLSDIQYINGPFLVSKSCNILKTNYQYVKYQARRQRNSFEEMGVWRSFDNKWLILVQPFLKWQSRI